MSFMIKDDDALVKYHEICDETRKLMRKEFDSEPVYNDKYIKTKGKLFYVISLSVTTIDSVWRWLKYITLKNI